MPREESVRLNGKNAPGYAKTGQSLPPLYVLHQYQPHRQTLPVVEGSHESYYQQKVYLTAIYRWAIFQDETDYSLWHVQSGVHESCQTGSHVHPANLMLV